MKENLILLPVLLLVSAASNHGVLADAFSDEGRALQVRIAAPQAQVATLQQERVGLKCDDQVQTLVNLKIRRAPNTKALLLARAPVGATGVLFCKMPAPTPPVLANNMTWWYIKWDSPSLPAGWSAEGASEAAFLAQSSRPSDPVACTQEVKPCPNGSFVGRTGPNCEFAACPSGNVSIISISPSSGPIGTKVTLTGSGFAAEGNSITLGGVPNAVIDLSPSNGTTLTFTIPSRLCNQLSGIAVCPALNPGTYQVSVVTPKGTSNSTTFTVTSGKIE